MESEAVDKLSAEYLELRGQREILKAGFTAEDSVLEARMDEIENALVDALNSSGATSISTENAIVIRRVATHYSPTDWNSIYQLVDKHKAFGLFFKRLNTVNMKQFLEEHPDEFPAGLNVDSRYAVTVKRKSST
jgi:hypothetical protein